MQPSRRDFLRASVGSSALLACGLSVPTFLARTANALAAGSARNGRVLVVLQLDGGNDGLNTVVPYGDDAYLKHRPRLHLAKNTLHRIDDHVGLHPALAGLEQLLQKRQLAVVQSVGYPNPNRSHFESMAIWHAGRLHPDANKPGWLARALDEGLGRGGGDAPALHISSEPLTCSAGASPPGRPRPWSSARASQPGVSAVAPRRAACQMRIDSKCERFGFG